MASFFDEIARNKLKSVVLMTVFSLFFVGVIFLFSLYLGLGLFGLVLAVILVVIYGIFVYWSGDKFVLKMSGAKPADPKEYRLLYDTVEGLASANRLPVPKVYVITDPNPNAFATGRNKKHASIAVTTGLLAIMDRDELQGVLAHEMSHIYDNDILFMLVAVVFAGAIGVVAGMARMSLFFGGMGGGGGRNQNGGIILLIGLVIGLLAPFFALLIRLAISRRREYMADANGARITRNPRALADALRKIKGYSEKPNSAGVKRASEVTSSLYFSNPFKAGSLSNLFSTHPPIDERIKRLQSMY